VSEPAMSALERMRRSKDKVLEAYHRRAFSKRPLRPFDPAGFADRARDVAPVRPAFRMADEARKAHHLSKQVDRVGWLDAGIHRRSAEVRWSDRQSVSGERHAAAVDRTSLGPRDARTHEEGRTC
jgi:hypothetical protein